uniref:Uncharacterized protein n=1 Tax=Anguilla anguilla TaxID=7936 RepID=A0A0E9RV43_ANGAN
MIPRTLTDRDPQKILEHRIFWAGGGPFSWGPEPLVAPLGTLVYWFSFQLQ